MPEFNTGLPSVRLIQSYIRENKNVEIKVITQDVFIGRIIWQDPECLCLIDENNKTNILWRHSLVYTSPKAN